MQRLTPMQRKAFSDGILSSLLKTPRERSNELHDHECLNCLEVFTCTDNACDDILDNNSKLCPKCTAEEQHIEDCIDIERDQNL